jgi:hypothetical protein
MYESLHFSESGANGDAPSPTTDRPAETGEASDRYGDVPLGVESAWPLLTLPLTA